MRVQSISKNRRLKLKWLLPFFVFIIDCGSIQRSKDKTKVTVDGHSKQPVNTVSGCDGQPDFRQKDEQFGGGAKIDYRKKNGLAVMGSVRMTEGRTTELRSYIAMPESSTASQSGLATIRGRDRYRLIGLSSGAGYQWQYFGLFGGASYLQLNDGDDHLLLPWARLQIGDQDKGYFEAQYLADDPIIAVEGFKMGGAFLSDRWEGHFGLTFFSHAMLDSVSRWECLRDPQNCNPVDPNKPELELGSEDSLFAAGLYADLTFRFTDKVGAHLSLILSDSPVYTFGLTYHWFGPDEKTADGPPKTESNRQ
ncbi:MAG: hypothetical protein VYA30_05190 [Myxococcota bacterium]|nr:hypothetical protein [Myxococcota bacterium]